MKKKKQLDKICNKLEKSLMKNATDKKGMKKYIQSVKQKKKDWKASPIKYIRHVPIPPIKKKIKPHLPDINTATIRYRNAAMIGIKENDIKKSIEAINALNNMLPPEYRVKFESWFWHALEQIERQMGKYRDDNWTKEIT